MGGLTPKGAGLSLCARERSWAEPPLARPSGTPLRELGPDQVKPVQYEYRQRGLTVRACGFEPAKVLVRGLTATPTASLPGPFR